LYGAQMQGALLTSVTWRGTLMPDGSVRGR
jgi:hypothetical protein